MKIQKRDFPFAGSWGIYGLLFTFLLFLGACDYDFPSEDELPLITWEVEKVVYHKNYMELAIDVGWHFIEGRPDVIFSNRYYYDFDATHRVKLSDLVLIDGKPIGESYQISHEFMSDDGGGRISFASSTPLDPANAPQVAFDTETIFYNWSRRKPGLFQDPEHVCAKIKFITKTFDVRY